MKLVEIMQVYEGSNGDATKALYERLQKDHGPLGFVAMNLFRAQKASARAKMYRGTFKGVAYDKKSWSLGLLCDALVKHGAEIGLQWGWGIDPELQKRGDPHHHVLYLDLPTGQVSYHNGSRKAGTDYPGKWDGVRGASPDRVCRWIGTILNHQKKARPPERDDHDAEVQAGYPISSGNPFGERP